MNRRLKLGAIMVAFAIISSAGAEPKVPEGPPPRQLPDVKEKAPGYCRPKICVAEPDKKKTPKTTYDCKTEEFCVPKCPHCCWWKKLCGKGSGEGPCLECECPRTKRVLIKKVREEECDILKCKLKELPCGDGGVAREEKR
jgi:hypothetical protein